MKLNLSCLSIAFLLVCSAVGAQESQREPAAKRWINQNAEQFGIEPYHQLNLSYVKKGHSGETLRFQQMVKDVPVFQSEIVVHFNQKGEITYTSDSFKKNVTEIPTTPVISSQEAIQKANVASQPMGEITFEECKLYVYNTGNDEAKLVQRVVISSSEKTGSWETIVDAMSGEILSVKDIAIYHHKHGDNNDPHKKSSEESTSGTVVEGTGYIFNPDPLSQVGVNYGGQYVDGNDATNASLDAARTLVTLPELELSGGMYKLKGTYAEIKELEAPATGLFTQASNAFLFNRNEQGFEAVNVYWHVDNTMRYINETLGIECLPMTNGGVVWFDPHALSGDDNSYYTNGRIHFGEGGVDDAEDADVVIHELGHGIHDFLTNGNLSQVEGLSEGSGDYIGQSYSRSLNQWEETDPQYQWFFSWDGHNPFWGGRTTGYNATYPGGLIDQIHTDGQIWATSLMRIYDRIGREKTDRAFYEGLAMTNSTTNQQNAARAVRQAALDMVGQFGFTCADIIVITEEFTETGYNMPAYDCEDMAVNDLLNGKLASVYPNPTSDKLNIIMDFKKTETAVVLDMTGRKVLESQIGSNKSFIEVGNLPKGVYVLSIKGTSFTQKFVKE